MRSDVDDADLLVNGDPLGGKQRRLHSVPVIEFPPLEPSIRRNSGVPRNGFFIGRAQL
jgi:hypothetical protein